MQEEKMEKRAEMMRKKSRTEKAKLWLVAMKEKLTLLKMDGVPNVVRPKIALLKFLWFVIIIAFAGVCAYLITASIQEYLTYPVSTKTRVLQEQQSVFPTITICPMYPFSTDYAQHALEKANGATNMFELERYQLATTGRYMNDTEKQLLTNLDMLLIECTTGVTCNSSDFEWIWHPSKYNCYRFNSDKRALVTTSFAGYTNFKLDLTLYTGLPNKLSDLVGKDASRGFYLYIQNVTDYPFDPSPPPLLVTPGFGVFVNVMRSFYSQYNAWPFAYSTCRVSEENELLGSPLTDNYLFEEVAKAGYAYSRSTCLLFCAQLETVRACQCNSYNISMRVDDYELCLSPEQLNCSNSFYSDTFKTSEFMREHCLAKCPLECSQRTLTTNLAYFKYPTLQDAYYHRYFSDTLRRLPQKANQTDFTNFNNLLNNMVRLTVYYDSLSYSLQEEKPGMTFINLIGTLGGHTHLCLGMSLLSFIELIELIVLGFNLHFATRSNYKR